MTPSLPEDRFAWLNLVGNTMPPRDPNNGDDDEDDEEDEEDEDREPAVIREPDKTNRPAECHGRMRFARDKPSSR